MKNLKSFFDTPAKAAVSIVVIVAVLALTGAAGAAVARNSFTEGRKEPSAAAPDDGAKDKETAKITLEQAKEIALSDAKAAEADVTFTKEKLEYDDGISVYDLEFLAGNTEYEYEIEEDTGAIYSKSKETLADSQKKETQAGQENAEQTGQAADNAVSNISEEKAKSIAVGHAGFSEADVRFTKAKLDQEDGDEVYEIEFHKDGMEYDYEINAATGDIIEYSSDKDDDAGDAGR